MVARADLERAAAAALELQRRRREHPLRYAVLWDQPEPRTSQRRAFADALAGGVTGLLLLGGNGTGKTWCAAVWALVMAQGADHVDVVAWATLNGLDISGLPVGPGRVWVASETFAAAKEQIRVHLRDLAPAGSTYRKWDADDEAELHLPGGGVIVSKAYRQYVQNTQTWEGAQIRAVVFDEEPPSPEAMSAAWSRTRSLKTPGLPDPPPRWFWLCALTPLRGKNWFYRTFVAQQHQGTVVRWLHGADNPHLDQRQRQAILAAAAAWQRAARDRGEFSAPEGRIYGAFDRAAHEVEPFALPVEWVRWQGIDWGSRTGHIVWAAESPQGDLYVYRELAVRRSALEPAVPTSRLLLEAREAEGGDYRDCLTYRVADSEDPGAIIEAAQQGLLVEGARKGAGSVTAGITLVEALLATVDPITLEPCRPRLRFFRNACPVLVEELEGYRWARVSEGAEPRPDPTCADHGPDALRYLVQYRHGLGMA